MADNMSFLPEDYLEKKIARRTNAVFVGLFALTLGTVLFVDFVSRQQSQSIIAELSAKNGEFEQMKQQFEEIEELEAKKRQMQQKANVAASLQDSVLKSNVFSELVNNLPPTVRLEELELQTKADPAARPAAPATAMEREKRRRAAARKGGAPAVNPVVPTRVDLELSGFAPTDVAISEYIGALNGHPMFADVNLMGIKETKDGEDITRQFSVGFRLDPQFDPAGFEPLRKTGLSADPMSETLHITPDATVPTPAEQLGSVPTY